MKVEIVELTVFSADDGKKFDSAEGLANYKFSCYIENMMDMADVDPREAVEYIVRNWAVFADARKDIIQQIQHLALAAAENHKNLQGVL